MRVLLFLGFLVLSVLIPVGLAQAQPQGRSDLARAENHFRESNTAIRIPSSLRERAL